MRSAPFKFAFEKLVEPDNVVDDPSVAERKLAPYKFAPERFALDRLVPVKVELRSRAFEKFTLVKFAEDAIVTPFKFEPLRFEPVRFTDPKLEFPRIAPRRSRLEPRMNPFTRT